MNEKRKKISQEMRIGITLAAISVIFLVTLLVVRNVATGRRPSSNQTSYVTSVATSRPQTNSVGNSSGDKPIDSPIEDLQRPFRSDINITVYRYFFDSNLPEGGLALVEQPGGGVIPSVGVDYKAGEERFQVYAAFSGVITRLETKTDVGNVIEITSPDNLVSVYQSITPNPLLALNKVVQQGDFIGNAATSVIGNDAAVHLHFALKRNTAYINPELYFGSELTSI